MAGTLHDEVGQMLTTINMDLDFVKENLHNHAFNAVDEMEKIQNRIKDSMEYFSGLSRGLRPHILQDLGLLPAIKSLLQTFREKSTLAFHFYTKDIPEQISDETALAIYRIVQEAVTNCIRHAQAKNIFVNLTQKGESILITIEDDGMGFEYDNMTAGTGGRDKFGVITMNERAVQAGGEFHIESQNGKGTQVIAEIPIK
jgi:signal transduction histidine kinase